MYNVTGYVKHMEYFGPVGPSLFLNVAFCHRMLNGPFPSSCLPPLQSESKCEVFVMVITPGNISPVFFSFSVSVKVLPVAPLLSGVFVSRVFFA